MKARAGQKGLGWGRITLGDVDEGLLHTAVKEIQTDAERGYRGVVVFIF